MFTIGRMMCVAAAVCLGWTLAGGAAEPTGADPNGPNVADSKAASAGSAAEQVAHLSLAESLIRYGRQENSPEALITAARILASTATVELSERPASEPNPDVPSEVGTK